MILHKNKSLFIDAVTITAQQLNIPAIYVEKDYWVTFALHTIFHDDIGKGTVFKIGRFSEDIDLIVLRKEGDSGNKLINKIKKIGKVVSEVMPEIDIADITQKKGMNRKTAHTYVKEFQGNYGQIRDVIIVEAIWLGYFEPYSTKAVSSFICDMMLKNDQESIAKVNGLLPFNVLALEPVRTFCEKIMSLVRFSYSADPYEVLKKKIRHTYDLHQLLREKEILNFFNSSAFDLMFLKIANDDVASFKNNSDWLIHHPNKAKIFYEIESVWKQLIPSYNGAFKDLVFGNFPNESEILATLKQIKERLSSIKWTIEITK